MPAYNVTRGWHGLSTDWMQEGSCSDPDVPTDVFFKELGRSASDKLDTLEAKQICLERCPVRDDCLDYALEAGIADGVWGGMDGDEREQVHRRRRSLRRAG